jgi:hypothetical protein
VDLSEACEEVGNKIEMYQTSGSGWLIGGIKSVSVSTMQFNPIQGSSYIKTPQFIEHKKATVNNEHRQ